MSLFPSLLRNQFSLKSRKYPAGYPFEVAAHIQWVIAA
jgi:hypothetical protein